MYFEYTNSSMIFEQRFRIIFYIIQLKRLVIQCIHNSYQNSLNRRNIRSSRQIKINIEGVTAGRRAIWTKALSRAAKSKFLDRPRCTLVSWDEQQVTLKMYRDETNLYNKWSNKMQIQVISQIWGRTNQFSTVPHALSANESQPQRSKTILEACWITKKV